MKKIAMKFTDRYEATGTPYPNPQTMCKGQCEGMGWVPVCVDDENDGEGAWHNLWLEAEKKEPTDDGYHFVVCPRCNGSRLEPKE